MRLFKNSLKTQITFHNKEQKGTSIGKNTGGGRGKLTFLHELHEP